MLTAPILHARTKYNDFPYGLLVVPQDFSQEDVLWARKYITQSTRYFDTACKEGRRVIFCNRDIVVTGLSIRIGDLYALCGKQPRYDKVDGNRTNFAFIGLAIPKEEICNPIDIPYSVFLQQYEAYMEQLWGITYEENGLSARKAAYEELTLPPAAGLCEIPPLSHEQTRCVLDSSYAPLDSICAQVTMLAKDSAGLGFCSDIPNASYVTKSDFTIVAADNAQNILSALERQEQKQENPPPAGQVIDRNKPSAPCCNSSVLKALASGMEKTWKAIPKAVKILGGFVIVLLAANASKKTDRS